ncbi:unnamed protein product [Haemonchus placei]|uniref:Uncharacterized protein n=1 Tax=Haemonchus placei TaxID=6290 RepID=A0A0N4WSE0_HAEPC|nr:unnamed protein product [Haemonchus placei]
MPSYYGISPINQSVFFLFRYSLRSVNVNYTPHLCYDFGDADDEQRSEQQESTPTRVHPTTMVGLFANAYYSGFNLNPGTGRSLPTGAFWPQQPQQPTSDAQSERSNSEASPPVVPTSTTVNHMAHNYTPGYPEWQAAQKAFAAAQSVNGAAAGTKFPPGPSVEQFANILRFMTPFNCPLNICKLEGLLYSPKWFLVNCAGFDMMSAAVNPMCPPEFYHPGITWPGYQYGQQYPFATGPYAQHMMDIPGLTVPGTIHLFAITVPTVAGWIARRVIGVGLFQVVAQERRRFRLTSSVSGFQNSYDQSLAFFPGDELSSRLGVNNMIAESYKVIFT